MIDRIKMIFCFFAEEGEYEPSVYILFTVLAALLAIGLCVLLFFGIKRDRAKFFENYVEKGVDSREGFEKHIVRTIQNAKRNTVFFLYQVDLRNYDDVFKILGEVQYRNFTHQVCEILGKILPFGIRIGMKGNKSVLMYVRNNLNFDVEGIAKLIIGSIARNEQLIGTYGIEFAVNVSAAGFPAGGATAEELIKNLELAMVISRRKGENNYAFYTADMGNKETDEYKYYQEIKDAMKAKEFVLYYQPVVDARSMNVVYSESLIRWKHRVHGVLPPSSFLYVMEQTGDINWVGYWCFEQMAKQLTAWFSNHEERFGVGINLSQRQLLNPEMAEEFKRIVRKFKTNPSYYTLEINNFGLYNTSETAKSNIDKLHDFGFKIAIDNFGSEFSSPAALDQLPIDAIKLNGDFWRKSKEHGITADIVEMLVKFASQKSVQVVAQGVENIDDVESLMKDGIHDMQGYAFSAPKEPRDFLSDVLLTPWSETLRVQYAAVPTTINEDAQTTVIQKVPKSAQKEENNTEQ